MDLVLTDQEETSGMAVCTDTRPHEDTARRWLAICKPRRDFRSNQTCLRASIVGLILRASIVTRKSISVVKAMESAVLCNGSPSRPRREQGIGVFHRFYYYTFVSPPVLSLLFLLSCTIPLPPTLGGSSGAQGQEVTDR